MSKASYKGTGSKSRANRIKDIAKRARQREPREQERTFLRGPHITHEARRFASQNPFSKTELRRMRKTLGWRGEPVRRAEAMRYLLQFPETASQPVM